MVVVKSGMVSEIRDVPENLVADEADLHRNATLPDDVEKVEMLDEGGSVTDTPCAKEEYIVGVVKSGHRVIWEIWGD